MNRLSATLHTAADEPVDVDLDLDAVHARVDRRRRRRVRARAAGCVVGVVALVGGVGLAAGAGGGEDDVRAAEGTFSPEETTTPPDPSSTVPVPESTTSDPTTTSTEPAPSTDTPPSTDAPPPSTEAPPATDAPAGPDVVRLRLAYSGTEHWQLNQPQCPQVTHRHEAVATAAPEASWAFVQDYCGEVRGDRWYGEGTWSLTAPDGSSLSGTYTSSAAMDGPGEPYTMVVDAGTGTLAGATGECQVVVDLTPLGFGSQRQEGTITCAVTPGAG